MPQLTTLLDDAGRACLDVQLSVSDEHEKTLWAKGMNMPAPRTARDLVDTGTTCTCVDISVIRALGIPLSREVHFSTPFKNASDCHTETVKDRFEVGSALSAPFVYLFINDN